MLYYWTQCLVKLLESKRKHQSVCSFAHFIVFNLHDFFFNTCVWKIWKFFFHKIKRGFGRKNYFERHGNNFLRLHNNFFVSFTFWGSIFLRLQNRNFVTLFKFLSFFTSTQIPIWYLIQTIIGLEIVKKAQLENQNTLPLT